MEQEHLIHVQYLIRAERASEAVTYIEKLPGSDNLADVLSIVQGIADIQVETKGYRIICTDQDAVRPEGAPG